MFIGASDLEKKIAQCIINDCMQISKEALAEFKEIWKDTYGEEIEDEKAHKYATQLLAIMRAVYGIDEK